VRGTIVEKRQGERRSPGERRKKRRGEEEGERERGRGKVEKREREETKRIDIVRNRIGKGK